MTEKYGKLLLASGSPRRFELLSRLGLPLEVIKPDVDESSVTEENPGLLVKKLAELKADAVFDGRATLLAADTIVVCNGEVLGKPVDETDAVRMWKMMSDNVHTVYTGYCIKSASGTGITNVVASEVGFVKISEASMRAYLQTEEWTDKAGGYAVQGISSFWIRFIRGSYTNVIGLPLAEVAEDLLKINKNWPAFPWNTEV